MTAATNILAQAVEAAPILEPWRTPRALHETEGLPPLPLDAFPDRVADYARAIAQSAQVDPTLAGAAILTVASAAATGRFRVATPWDKPEELALYVVASAGSGERKSTVLAAVTQPLREIEREWIDAGRSRARDAAIELELLDQRRKEVLSGDDPAAELASIDERREALEEVTVPSLLIDDATPEALAGLLSRNTASAAISAEGAFLAALTGRYSSGVPNLDLACKAYSGEPATVHRSGRDPKSIERPLLVIGQFLQPAILRRVLEEPRVVDQGLAARFSILCSTERERTWTFAAVTEGLQDAWDATIRRLTADTTDGADGAKGSGSSVSCHATPVLDLAGSAAERFRQFGEAHVVRTNPGGDLRSIGSWAARHPARVLRIAALLELLSERQPGPVSLLAVDGAIRIGDVLTEHAHASLTAATGSGAARKLLEWLATQSADSFTRRDAQRARFQDAGPALDDALAMIVRAGYARREPGKAGPQGGRPPSDTYLVNPRWDRRAVGA